jgi:hypothetical protein
MFLFPSSKAFATNVSGIRLRSYPLFYGSFYLLWLNTWNFCFLPFAIGLFCTVLQPYKLLLILFMLLILLSLDL